MTHQPMTRFDDIHDELDRREWRLVHTTRELTGQELDRLLHRYDLRETTRVMLAHEQAQTAWYAFESYCERMAEQGRATRYYTRLEDYQRMHPVYGPVTAPHPWRVDDDDEIPF